MIFNNKFFTFLIFGWRIWTDKKEWKWRRFNGIYFGTRGAPKEIINLVNKFERHIEAYQSNTYNETQVRREFIDPFFEALGWDIANKAGYAEAYKDVIHEDAIKIGGATKAPDCRADAGTA